MRFAIWGVQSGRLGRFSHPAGKGHVVLEQHGHCLESMMFLLLDCREAPANAGEDLGSFERAKASGDLLPYLPVPPRLGELLRQAREYVELSQNEVAKKLKLPRTAIAMIESGQRRLDALELKRFSEIYQRTVAYFTKDQELSASLPEDVEHLARSASKLSETDRAELTRFAEFLGARSQGKLLDGK